MSLTLAIALLHAAAFTAPTQASPAVADKLHPHLEQQLRRARPAERLSVYFVMRERLRYDDFFPRVRRMDKELRRATVVGELRAHMERTQRELVQVLSDQAPEHARILHRNYLGNFVRAEVTGSGLLAAAAVDGVAEVWWDHRPALGEVEDAAPAPPASAPGNGPIDTRAAEVWSTGITGAGVLWMNADSGVRASNSNLADVHPGLASGLWTNPDEILGNGTDDDANGYVDDMRGWNFGDNDANIEDNGGHGTNVAGVFVAVEHTNGDTLGNSPGALLMTGKLSGEASQWEAIQYALDNGAHGQSSSHSYKNNFNPPPNYMLHRDVGETSLAAGLVRTNSTSNNGFSCSLSSPIGKPFNISTPGCLPSPWIHPDQTLAGGLGGVLGIGAYDVGTSTLMAGTPCGPFAWSLPDLLAVLPAYPHAWDPNDNDYPWNGGASQALLKPDLNGPQGTRSTGGTNSYIAFGGTSCATPSVSSCLALALSANMSLTPEDLAMAVQTTAVERGPQGKDNEWGAGKVDAWELTKMARNTLRVDGSVAHTVHVSVSGNGTLDVDVDGIPNTTVWLARGTSLAATVIGELTIRVASPFVFTSGSTDAQGDFAWSVPLNPSMVGAQGYIQAVVRDPAFGPFTGSNAILVRIDA